MDEFNARLAEHAVLALDTSIFIYQFESHPEYLPFASAVLQHIQGGKGTGIASVIAIMELTVHPWKAEKSAVARQYETLLANFPNLFLQDMNRTVARRAAQLRAKHSLAPADALHVATALCHDATGFVTNDLKLQCVDEEIDVIVLEQFVA